MKVGKRLCARIAVAGFCTAASAVLTGPSAAAEPLPPVPPPPPPVLVSAPGPAPDITAASDAARIAPPPDGMQHLASPDNLPPGTTLEPTPRDDNPNVSFLRDLWHAVQNQELSGKDAAVLFFAQRPMNATPPPGMADTPQAPPGPAPIPVPAPTPAP